MSTENAATGRLRFISPFERFFKTESSSGIVLIATAILAFLWANSPWSDAYHALKHAPTTLGIGDAVLHVPLEFWVNDLLMAVFFFLVGLEIKREMICGELHGWARAALPVAGAVGGMIGPAVIYWLIAGASPYAHGWGVPMATDIAFAVGVLALLGDRIPHPLKVFLLAFAIVDDLGAVIVIALFYTPDLAAIPLLVSLLAWLAALLYGRAGGGRPVVFLLLGAIAWVAMLVSGVHATIAGVLMAFAVPIRLHSAPIVLDHGRGRPAPGDAEGVEVELHVLEELIEQRKSPLHAFEHKLAPWISFGIMPIFALFNAGVHVTGGMAIGAGTLGAFLGLLLGKPIGIMGTVWLGEKLGVLRRPGGVGWPMMLGVAMLGGIGFTMSLFVAGLAFDDPDMLDSVKLGVLSASLVASISGLMVLRAATPAR